MIEGTRAVAYSGWLDHVKVLMRQSMTGHFFTYTISTWAYESEEAAAADTRQSFAEVSNPDAGGGSYEIIRYGPLAWAVSTGQLKPDTNGLLPFEATLLNNPGRLFDTRTKVPTTWPNEGGVNLAEQEVRRRRLTHTHGPAVAAAVA